MTLSTLFDSSILSYDTAESLQDMNDIITAITPDGKSPSDFTGGYLQQLKNSTQFVAYFGTKSNTKNRATAKLTIKEEELDLYYLLLKAKIASMRQADTPITISISLSERRLARIQSTPNPFKKMP